MTQKILNQIKKEAEKKYFHGAYESDMDYNLRNVHTGAEMVERERKAFITGATAYAEKLEFAGEIESQMQVSIEQKLKEIDGLKQALKDLLWYCDPDESKWNYMAAIEHAQKLIKEHGK